MGFILSQDGIAIDPKRLQGILDMPPPATTKQLRAFLGTINFVRHYIPNLATLAKPLNILSGQKKFIWSQEHQNAFLSIKTALEKTEKLQFLDDNETIYVTTDASEIGMGALLWQYINNEKQAISTISRAFTPTETNWPPWERELRAIKFAFDKFEPMIADKHVILECDCTGVKNHRVEEGGKCGRWMLSISKQSWKDQHSLKEQYIETIFRQKTGT